MQEMKTAPSQVHAPDYIGMYEKAISDLVHECGSREMANELLDALQKHYEATDKRLKALQKQYWKDPEKHAEEKAKLLAIARQDTAEIIEAHVPHTADHTKELIVGASLAVAALLIPVTYAVSTLAVATTLVSIGSSYYIGFKMLKNWKAIAGKERVSRLAGLASPKNVKSLSSSVSKLPMTVKIRKS